MKRLAVGRGPWTSVTFGMTITRRLLTLDVGPFWLVWAFRL